MSENIDAVICLQRGIALFDITRKVQIDESGCVGMTTTKQSSTFAFIIHEQQILRSVGSSCYCPLHTPVTIPYGPQPRLLNLQDFHDKYSNLPPTPAIIPQLSISQFSQPNPPSKSHLPSYWIRNFFCLRARVAWLA